MSPTPNGNANANATAKNKGSKEGTISVPGRITTRGGPLPEAAASSVATAEAAVVAAAVAGTVEATPVGRRRLTTLRKAEAFAAALSSQRMHERSSTIALGRRAHPVRL